MAAKQTPRHAGGQRMSAGSDSGTTLVQAADGHPLAAAERARQREIARIKLDRLLGLSGRDWEPPRLRWECPGEFGGNGQWRPCCGRGAP